MLLLFFLLDLSNWLLASAGTKGRLTGSYCAEVGFGLAKEQCKLRSHKWCAEEKRKKAVIRLRSD